MDGLLFNKLKSAVDGSSKSMQEIVVMDKLLEERFERLHEMLCFD